MLADMSIKLARLSIGVVALVCCGGFALGIRQAHDTAKAGGIIEQSGSLTPAQSARARSLLPSASTLNPDREVDILRGELAVREGDAAGARRIFESVVSGEPMNLAGWVQLAHLVDGDLTLFRRVALHLHELFPPIPSSH